MYERNGQLVRRVFKRYFLPTIMMSMALSLGVIIDGIIVGNALGSDALAAVNLVLPVTLAFSMIYALFGVGGSVLAAIAQGKRENHRADVLFTLSIMLLLAVSLVLLLAGSAYLDELVQLLAGGSSLQTLVNKFLGVLIYGAPLLIMVPGLAYFVRSDGRPNLAAAGLITANVVNLILDLVFILGFNMDIRGAALATVVGYAAGLLVLGAYLGDPKRNLHFSLITLRDLKITTAIAVGGIPSAVGSGLLFVKILCINAIVLSTLGTSGMVTFSVCLSCLSLVSMFIGGAAQTMMPIVGTLYGEKDQAGVRFTVKRALQVVMTSCLSLVVIFELFPGPVLYLFGVREAAEVQLGSQAIRIFAVSLVGTGFSFLMMSYFQTIQRSVLATAIAVVQGVAVVVPGAFLLSAWWGPFGIWISFLLAEFCTFLLIWGVTAVLSHRSGGRRKGIFLLETAKEAEPLLDVTIANQKSEAVGLSEKVVQFCSRHKIDDKTARYVGLAVEEMAVNTIEHSYKKNKKTYIDVSLRITQEEVIIGFRDDGLPFDPTMYRPEEEKTYSCSGIMLVRAIAKNVDYSRLIGLNSVIIKIARN